MPERNLDFDTVINRKNTLSLKYDFAERRGMPKDVLPLWVADMDFKTSSYVEDALADCAHHAIFGYSETQTPYFQIAANWMQQQHHWTVEERWLVKTPGVVFALAMAVKAYTEPGDPVLIQQPVYYPFSEVIEDNGREVVSNTLVLGEDGKYHMDFDDFEHKIATRHIKLFLLCSPHNPVGRVWTEEELRTVGEICQKYGVIVVSDEIHEDFVWEGEHHVFADVDARFQEFSVICTSPSKTFNLAGMCISNIWIPNRTLRDKFRKELDKAGISQLGVMGLVACMAAYENGLTWEQAMLDYVRENIAYTEQFTKEHLPGVRLIHPEGTYLLWLDFRDTGWDPDTLEHKIVHEAKLWLDSGRIFGDAGRGFQRINVACPRVTLDEALHRIQSIL